ncbi:MAG: type II secretion system F family protein [Candidatus Nanosalina sp.]
MKDRKKYLLASELLLVFLNIGKILFQLLISELKFLDIPGLVLLVPLVLNSLALYLIKRREFKIKEDLENQFHRFLADLAEEVQVGMSLPEAINASTDNDYSHLTEEIKKTYSHITWGVPVNDALERLGKRSGSEHIQSSLSIVLDAAESGGKIINSLESTAEFSKRLFEIKRNRKRSTMTYVVTFYISFFIFIGIIVVLSKTLLPALAKTKTRGGSGSFELASIKNLMFYMALIQGSFSGAMAGKVGKGKVIAGVKHSIVMVTAAILIFYFMIF